ncbi:MAG: hypothetical protein GY827_09615 [Cytophagales bacterium]|nr:hypothetical protein [Cytophagales bacterium]
MNKYLKVLLVLFTLTFTNIYFSSYTTKVYPNHLVRQSYLTQLKQFEKATSSFDQQVEKASSKDKTKLLKAYLELRKEYKKAEFLMTYFDAEFVNQFINGAPLLHLEQNVANLNILEPEGLQVIDETLYEEELDIDVLRNLAGKLKKNVTTLVDNHQQIKIYNRHIFEASRLELIHTLSLGITGFDTPASLQGINDAQHTLSQLSTTFSFYEKSQTKTETKQLAKEVSSLLEKGAKYIRKNNDFDRFNRFEFIQKYINPAYGKILDLHLST